ncbi:MAG: FapA family protein [Bilophila sp.]
MDLYLQHYFDPDFNHLSLRPTQSGQELTDRYNLGYVQNVSKGQILAELIPLDKVADPLPRFITTDPVLPAGINTRVDPAYPHYLFADANGYVFYHEGKIVVKRLLNVRSDVDFHTGNIFFVGDAVIHKDVKAGFAVQANNLLINGIVEGGEIRARKDLKIEGGARGGANNRCLLDSGGDLRVSFVEKAEIRSKSKMLIERFCVHSSLYVAGDLVVNELVIGGTSQVAKYMLVRGNLGNKAEILTRVYLGYSPFVIRELEQCDKRLTNLTERINQYSAVVGHLPPDTNKMTCSLVSTREKRKKLLKLRESLWVTLHRDETQANACRLIVLGTVYPGVEISIGRSFLTIKEPLDGVFFRLRNDEIIIGKIPEKVFNYLKK